MANRQRDFVKPQPSALQTKRLNHPSRCTVSPRPARQPSLLHYKHSYQRNQLTYLIVLLKSFQLLTVTRCKRSPNRSTQTTCNEPLRCHLPSLPLYRIRNSVSPSPSFIFFANTSRSLCLPVAPAPRRTMPTAPLPRAAAGTLAVRLRLLEQRVQQVLDTGEVDDFCWTPEVWLCWAVISRG